jgi:hypothetical protein
MPQSDLWSILRHARGPLVLSLRAAGLLTMAPDCSSFAFPNISNTQRRQGNEQGNLNFWSVPLGNTMAVATMFLAAVAICRGVHVGIENPVGTHFFKFIQQICQCMHGGNPWDSFVRHTIHRCPYDSSPYPRLAKTYEFRATGDWIRYMSKSCTCPGGRHTTLGQTQVIGECRRWTGTPENLAKSAEYPDGMGRDMIMGWEKAAVLQSLVMQSVAGWSWHAAHAQDYGNRPEATAHAWQHKVKHKLQHACKHTVKPKIPVVHGVQNSESEPWADLELLLGQAHKDTKAAALPPEKPKKKAARKLSQQTPRPLVRPRTNADPGGDLSNICMEAFVCMVRSMGRGYLVAGLG